MTYAKEELWFICWVILNRPCIDLVDPGLWDIKLQCLYIFLANFLIWQGRWKAWVERYKCECWWRHLMPRPDAHLLHFLSYAYEASLAGCAYYLCIHSASPAPSLFLLQRIIRNVSLLVTRPARTPLPHMEALLHSCYHPGLPHTKQKPRRKVARKPIFYTQLKISPNLGPSNWPLATFMILVWL